MGIQHVGDVTLIRHAYVRTALRNKGIGGQLLGRVIIETRRPRADRDLVGRILGGALLRKAWVFEGLAGGKGQAAQKILAHSRATGRDFSCAEKSVKCAELTLAKENRRKNRLATSLERGFTPHPKKRGSAPHPGRFSGMRQKSAQKSAPHRKSFSLCSVGPAKF